MDLLLRRLITYAALAAGLLGAILALIGCAVAAIAGSAPSPAVLAAVVIGVGLAFALVARFLIRRIPWFGIALLVARAAAARRPGGAVPTTLGARQRSRSHVRRLQTGALRRPRQRRCPLASAWAASIRIAWFSLGGPHDLGSLTGS